MKSLNEAMLDELAFEIVTDNCPDDNGSELWDFGHDMFHLGWQAALAELEKRAEIRREKLQTAFNLLNEAMDQITIEAHVHSEEYSIAREALAKADEILKAEDK